MDYFDLLAMARKSIEHLAVNKEFLLKDLFEGTFWKSLQKKR